MKRSPSFHAQLDSVCFGRVMDFILNMIAIDLIVLHHYHDYLNFKCVIKTLNFTLVSIDRFKRV